MHVTTLDHVSARGGTTKSTCRVPSAKGTFEEHASGLLLRHEGVCADISISVVALAILDCERIHLH